MPQPRPGLLDIPPFQLGESSIPGIAQPIVLASNECAAEPSPQAIAAYHAATAQLRRYPDAAA
jgi:histidinol-phosphate aminotransferase